MNKKAVLKIIGALLIISALIVFAIPADTVNAVTASTTDFLLNESTLVKYTGAASTVSIPSTVKVIGNEAFADNAVITSVVIPESVEKINYAAFSGCSNLTKIVIPDKVEEIDTAAFCNCTSLSDVSIGSGLKKLGTGVFTGCTSLSDVKIASKFFVCEDSVIYNKDHTKLYQVLPGKKEKAYSMPNTIEYALAYSFYGCSNLDAVTLSPNLDEVSAFVFSNCISLKDVTIPYSVNTIDAKAFENCINLCDVNIPESVTYIHKTAFDGCPNLNIIASPLTYAARWFESLDRSQAAVIDNEENSGNIYSDEQNGNSQNGYDPNNPANTDDTNSGGGNGNGSDTPSNNPSDNPSGNPSNDPNSTEPGGGGQDPTNVPNTIEDIFDSYVSSQGLIGESIVVGRKAVVFINNTEQTVYDGVAPLNRTEEYSGIISDMSGALETETNGKGLSLPKFAIIGNRIASKAFYGDTTLTEYEISDDIKAIGDFSFARTNLNKITIPEGVTDIGYGAFYHCENLSNVVIPSTVVNIEPAAFAHTRMMDNWETYGSGDFFICGDGILIAYRGKDSRIRIPEGVKQIGPEAFKDHKGITEVFLPDSLTRICEDAFSGCTNLKSLNGGVNLKTIEDRAFSGCPLDCVRIVDTVESIGNGAFNYDQSVAGDDVRACVFFGNTLPKLTHNKTTTRLTNSSYRVDALQGVKVAVVNAEDVLRDGTILDRNLSGFSGLICVITKENDAYSNGTLNIIDCTLTKEEAQSFTVPKTMIIFGKGYNFNEEQLSFVLDSAKEGSFSSVSSNDPDSVGGLKTGFVGSDKEYILNISNDASVNTDIVDAYKRIYGDTVPGNLSTFDISLRESGNEIMLTKFGKQRLSVTVSLPANVPTSNLHVICVDEDKQLEDLPFKLVEQDGKLGVRFDINHTGDYGLYSFNSTAVSNYNLDDSPDTGDRIHPKTVLSIGLLFAGLAFLLYKKRI